MEKFKCCLCGNEVEGYGNNPSPIETQNEDDECCDECNLAIVIPTRMELVIIKNKSNVN
jgi:DNA-directed RNA polymerase subunit RPC12/RpoP